jgi:hypothetical protein
MSSWRFHRPPRAIKSAKLDNLLLLPASLLPKMASYRAAANRLPRGQVLIVTPAAKDRKTKILESVATQLESKGRHVTTLTID